MLLLSATALGLFAIMKKTNHPAFGRALPLLITSVLVLALVVGLAAAITWGGPKDIAPLASINDPFSSVDNSRLPPVQQYTARDGTSLARPGNGNWASVGLPRIVALTLLNQVGITRWNDLPVLRFALNDVARSLLTPSYSYALMTNFRPHNDYQRDIRHARGTVCIVAGQNDELFYADRFADLFAKAGKPVPVTLVAGINHIQLTLDAAAVRTVAQACKA